MLAPERLDQLGGNSRRPEKNNCVKARIETSPHDGGTIVEARAPPTPELTFLADRREDGVRVDLTAVDPASASAVGPSAAAQPGG
jgi:hypothetical protein